MSSLQMDNPQEQNSENTLSEKIRLSIIKLLENIENARGLRVIFAAETGSRGQGFSTLESDCDVKGFFTYSTEQYLSVQEYPSSFLCEQHDIIVEDKQISVDLSLVEFRQFAEWRINGENEKLNLTFLSTVQYVNLIDEKLFDKFVFETMSTPFNATLSDLGTFITKRMQKEEVEYRKILNIIHTLLALAHFSNSRTFKHYCYDIWAAIASHPFLDARTLIEFKNFAKTALEHKNNSRKATIKKRLLPKWFSNLIDIYSSMQKREENYQETKEFKELAEAIHLDILKKIEK